VLILVACTDDYGKCEFIKEPVNAKHNSALIGRKNLRMLQYLKNLGTDVPRTRKLRDCISIIVSVSFPQVFATNSRFTSRIWY